MNRTKPPMFIADTMLGKLARYLRVMGYDTLYQSKYSDQELAESVTDGRILLTRHAIIKNYPHVIFIDHDLVKNQLKALDKAITLTRDQSRWFMRCLTCNSLLTKAELDSARQHVPDFIFFTYQGRIVFCPTCNRYYWPGSHRERMVERLKEWGF